MAKLQAQNEDLSKQLEDLKAFVKKNVTAIDDDSVVPKDKATTVGDGQSTGTPSDQDKDKETQAEVHDKSTETQDEPPTKRRLVERSTNVQDGDIVTVDLTREQRQSSVGPRVLNRSMVSAAYC